MNVSKKPFALCAAAALLLLTGCWLGDRFATTRTVSLTFPVPAGQSKVSLSVTNGEVQEALKVIDAVLTSAGLTRDPNPPPQNVPGFIASYVRYSGTGPRPPGTSVYLEDGHLYVAVVEWGNRSGHLTTDGKRICKSLRDELRKRYGAGKVRIER
jgi:hypothetical protein